MLTLPYIFSPKTRTGAGAGVALLCAITTLIAPRVAHAGPDTAAPGRNSLPVNTAGPSAAVVVPRIHFGGVPLAVPTENLSPFRDLEDGKIYVAPEMLAPLGVTFMVDRPQNKVALAGPEGRASAQVASRTRPGVETDDSAPVFVPAEEAIEALGGRCFWNAATNTLFVRSVLTEVQMFAGQLRIKATLPVLPKQIRSASKPGMVILDFPGAVIEGQPRPLDLGNPSVAQARIGQFSQDTARVVLEMAGGAKATSFYVLGGKPAAQVVLNPSLTPPPAGIIITNNNPSGTMVAKSAAPTPARAAKAYASKTPPTFIRGVTFRRVSDTQAQIVVAAGRALAARPDLSRGRLTIDIVNATLSASAGDALASAKHPFLRTVSLLPRGSAAAQLVVDLTRTVTYAVRMSPTGGFVLDMMLPRSAGGRMAGKLVVIDAGHGGSDSGARGTDGSLEKNVTLGISSKLADSLRDMGANVIMTRANDAFIPVGERPRIANRAGADFFISIHGDSASRNRSVNGSTVYYHMQLGSCRALAQSIVDRFSDMGGIRTKGIRSDSILYNSGLGVLRGAQMVAVLCETGYMSNPGDVNKLNDVVMQKRIAQSIADGLKDYVEGNPNVDTRNIQPQSEGVLAPLSSSSEEDVRPVVGVGGGGSASSVANLPSVAADAGSDHGLAEATDSQATPGR